MRCVSRRESGRRRRYRGRSDEITRRLRAERWVVFFLPLPISSFLMIIRLFKLYRGNLHVPPVSGNDIRCVIFLRLFSVGGLRNRLGKGDASNEMLRQNFRLLVNCNLRSNAIAVCPISACGPSAFTKRKVALRSSIPNDGHRRIIINVSRVSINGDDWPISDIVDAIVVPFSGGLDRLGVLVAAGVVSGSIVALRDEQQAFRSPCLRCFKIKERLSIGMFAGNEAGIMVVNASESHVFVQLCLAIIGGNEGAFPVDFCDRVNGKGDLIEQGSRCVRILKGRFPGLECLSTTIIRNVVCRRLCITMVKNLGLRFRRCNFTPKVKNALEGAGSMLFISFLFKLTEKRRCEWAYGGRGNRSR